MVVHWLSDIGIGFYGRGVVVSTASGADSLRLLTLTIMADSGSAVPLALAVPLAPRLRVESGTSSLRLSLRDSESVCRVSLVGRLSLAVTLAEPASEWAHTLAP